MVTCEWKPLQCLTADSECNFALLMLNQSKPVDKLLKVLWNKASLKVAVDGGTNHVYDTFVNNRDSHLPDLITGDFDSIQRSVKEYYQEQGVDVIETPDQNYTDFTKALRITSQRLSGQQLIAVLGSFGGRFDHVFANVNTLYEASQFCDVHIVLYSEDAVAFLLQPGSHIIHVDPKVCGEWCGLIPIGEPCYSVTTQGLKWNVEKQKLKFGDLISTSNRLESETTTVVAIETDKPLLWTMGIKISNVYSMSC